jgi:hypothetical protein
MVYELRITLEDIEPPIWRRVRVPAEITLASLHEVIQIAMGWTDTHLHQYVIGGETIGVPDEEIDQPISDEKDVRLVDVALVNTRIFYEYDLGDRWSHEVLVERIERDETSPAVCLGGARACPPEDCGGAHGYQELLEVLANPSHEDHEDRRAWLGGFFDTEAFDADEVNALLRKGRPHARDHRVIPSTLLH